jgi:hypothetical protein
MTLESPTNTVNNIIAKHCLTHHISGRQLCRQVGASEGYLSEINRGSAHSVVLKFMGHVEFPAEVIEWAKEQRRQIREEQKRKRSAPVERHWWHGVPVYPGIAQMRLMA